MKYIISIVVIALVVWVYQRQTGTWHDYKQAVQSAFSTELISEEIIVEEDLKDLPQIVQKFMKKSGVIGQSKVTHFKLVFEGEMRLEQDSDWAPIEAEQYNFMEQGQRFFYITMKEKGLKIHGLHHYDQTDASMVIKILDLIKVVDNRGGEMHKAETVTYFNDICVFAPGALLSADIDWTPMDERRVKATLKQHGMEVSAILTFDEEGRLSNFVSQDRLSVDKNGEAINVPWSTPMMAYQTYGNHHLPSEGEAIWHYEEGDFSYIRLKVKEVMINPEFHE